MLFINSHALVSGMKCFNRRESDKKGQEIILKVNKLIFNTKIAAQSVVISWQYDLIGCSTFWVSDSCDDCTLHT